MVLESAVLLLVLGLIFASVAGVCFLCVCLSSVPLGSLVAVAFGFMSLNYLNARSRRRSGAAEDYEGMEMDSSSSAALRPRVVTPHQVYDVNGETVAEAYLVAPLVSHAAVVATADKDSKELPVASAPPSDPANAITEGASSCGDYGMFRDAWCAALFLFQLILLTYLCVSQIIESLNSLSENGGQDAAANKKGHGSSGSGTGSEEKTEATGLYTLLSVFFVLASLAIAVGGSLYLTLLIRFGEQIITGMLYISMALSAVGCVLSLINGQIFGALIAGVFAALTYWFMVSCRDRIVFAGAVLKAATSAVKEHHVGLMCTAMLMIFTKCMYAVVWGAAFFSVFSKSFETTSTTDPDTGDTSTEVELKPTYGIAMFLMSISLYWGTQVFTNIVSSTVSGTVAVWWFQPSREAPVRGSLFRACTTSFGSICLGSLIVAVLHALRNLIQSIRDRVQNRNGNDRRNGGNGGAGQFALLCVLCLGEWILAQLESLMQYFNKYAFVYNAAYGTNFTTSGSKVMDLFRRRGWSAIINDDLVSNAFLLGNLALGLGTAACGALLGMSIEGGGWGANMGIENATTVLGLMGFFLGLAVGVVMTNLVSSAVASVFVYFAEDPSALQKNHMQVYDELVSVWSMIHPTSLAFMPSYSSPGGQATHHAYAV